MIRPINEVLREIDQNIDNRERILQKYAESIIDECAKVCITDDVIQKDIKRVKEQIV